ncbi:MAG: hypothetical protein LBK12_00955, partial [Odoribacteraceae bacterium]|nr:hypothetical protein [Odoribacteraceae bacterium]
NNYYDVLGLNGTVLGSGVSTLEDWGTDPDCYSSTGSGDERYTGTPGLLFDELSGGGQASVSNVVDFGAGNVLAYNLLSRNTTGYFPHLVVKLKDVVLAGGDDSTYGGEWFLTVTGVAKATAPTQNLDFEAGKVYRIVDLGFGPGDLSYPEPTDKQVTVTVEVQDWEIVDVIPTF